MVERKIEQKSEIEVLGLRSSGLLHLAIANQWFRSKVIKFTFNLNG